MTIRINATEPKNEEEEIYGILLDLYGEDGTLIVNTVYWFLRS